MIWSSKRDCDLIVGMDGESVVIDMQHVAKLFLPVARARELARKLLAVADILDPPAPKGSEP